MRGRRRVYARPMRGNPRVRLIGAVVCLAAAACTSQPRRLDWRISAPDPDLRSRIVSVRARILEGGCEGTIVRHETAFRVTGGDDGSGIDVERPPTLGPGEYSFTAVGLDASCTRVAHGCITERLPFGDGRGDITVTLSSAAEVAACHPRRCHEGLCTEGDAGQLDAGPMDGGVRDDAAPGDAGPAEGGPGDAGDGSVGPPSCNPSDSTLVACHAFEGDLSDGSGYGNDLRDSRGTSTFGRGKVGSALSHATGDLIYMDPDSSFEQPRITIELWVRPSTLPGDGERAGLVDRNGDFGIFLAGGGVPRCVILPGNVLAPGPSLEVGEWTHLACTHDEDTLRLYIDGTAVASDRGDRTTPPAGEAIRVGGNSPSGSDFVGDVDELRIWRVARSAEEIAASASR